MNALDQLKEHVSFLVEMELKDRFNYGTSDCLLLDHGPAIVDLLETALLEPRYDGERNLYFIAATDARRELRFPRLADAEAYILAAVRLRAAALSRETPAHAHVDDFGATTA